MDFSNDGFTHTNVAELAPILRFAFFSAGERSLEEVHTFAKYAADCGIPQVIFTMGTRGACGISQGQFWQADACVIQPVDALGAGDAFIAAFLYTFWENGGSALLAAEQAAHFAADCCLHYGAFGHPFLWRKAACFPQAPKLD
ncbi:PfkB family carbohydrate kinase [Oscillibacter sp.]|uniref:PfkB family carbohydrate kinase n=1 Tax=Oscillibacter sp. TaxID=1945593 RepID=UPI00338F0692